MELSERELRILREALERYASDHQRAYGPEPYAQVNAADRHIARELWFRFHAISV